MSVDISNKKYSVLRTEVINNKDIVITQNGNYYPPDGYTGLGLVRVQIPEHVYEEKVITPTTSQQIILPSVGYDGLSKVTINAVTSAVDSNIKARNIAKGITILGVTGTLEFVTEDLNITPKKTAQSFSPTRDGYYNINVAAVTSEIDENIKPENILSGVRILGVTGNVMQANHTTRNILENGRYLPPSPYNGFSEVVVDVKAELTPIEIEPKITEQIFDAPDSYHGYSPITVAPVTNEIDANIIPENIKDGVTILGVTGSSIEKNLQVLNVDINGHYVPESPYNGFSEVNVNINTVNNTTLTITASGETQIFTPNEPYTGFETVTVNPAPLQSRTFTASTNTAAVTTLTPTGTYYGMSSVKIDLTWILNQLEALNAGDIATTSHLQNKTVTAAGTYTADSGYDGLGTVTVDLSWVDEAIEQASIGNCDGTVDGLIADSALTVATDADKVNKYAFYYNEHLQKVVLNNAMSIGEYAFAHTALSKLVINTQAICTLTDLNAFTTSPDIYVPDVLVDSYKNAENWVFLGSKIHAISTL